MEDVLFAKHTNGAAEMTLNRPRTINSLTYDMLVPMKKTLLQWEKDPEVKLVILNGAGEKGFCAGGDMKALYDAAQKGEGNEQGEKFFELEYEVDQMIHDYPKPIVAIMDGVVMGGGVGLSAGASHRIVTEATKWAMPEMNISFFPDVGATYHLNRAPGYIGRYLALTATVINASDVLYIGTADYFVKQEELAAMIEEIKEVDWHQGDVEESLQGCINQFTTAPSVEGSLPALLEEIDTHFRFTSVEEIVASLENSDTSFALETVQTLQSKSPVSLKVTLQQLVDAANRSFAECLETDYVIAGNFMDHPDFLEGVRSVLIDKDRSPDYEYRTLADVSDEAVASFFHEG